MREKREISKENKNPEVIYLYFEHFKYNNVSIGEWLDFHPMSGRVYRCIKFKYMGKYIYKVVINVDSEQGKGLILDSLSDDNEAYSYEAEVINTSNMSDMEIDSEDLQKIIEWEDNGHDDLFGMQEEIVDDIEDDDFEDENSDEDVRKWAEELISNAFNKAEEDTFGKKKKLNSVNKKNAPIKASSKKDKFFEFQESFTKRMIEISKAKNSDYAGDEDPFANFTSVGKEWAEIGFYTRMMDKMSRIKSFIKKGSLEVKDESVTDTLMDLANYCVLFAGYLNQKKGNN